MKIVSSVDEFKMEINKGLVLVDFFATWCGPCKMLSSVLEEVKDSIDIIKIDVDELDELASDYNINSVPTLLFFNNGQLVKKSIGYHDKEELLNIINDLKN